ncbi:hypothetical protein [Turneriella parva]|uniref:hypothetical protein n=1 Tax=Turneriella parva TaxID=29510 RepID=UPI0005A55D3E|nr:hypothetical protein [Turneriella parva]
MLLLNRTLRVLLVAFACSAPLGALYQEYQLAGSIAAAPGYSFATAQYRLYANEVLYRKDFLAFEYDLDSLYGDYAYAVFRNLRLGGFAKAHVFDYQNLNHIVDASTGAETKSVSLNAPFYRGAVYAEARYHELSLRYSVGAQRYELSRRETTNAALQVASPGAYLVHQVSLGYFHLSAPKPYAIQGVAAFANIEAQKLIQGDVYVWRVNGADLGNARQEVVVNELIVRGGAAPWGNAVRLMAMARAGATNFALPGHAQDIIQSFSVGGPEARYRRVAGYSFSEFRAPAFSLINLDAIVHAAGPLNLWFVADAAAFDREYNSSRFHAGAGVGFIIDLPDGVAGSRSAVFSRIEAPFFAAGGNRFQIFLGMNGQVF